MDRFAIGKKIAALRTALREGQAIFGERFGVEQATVSRWEKGSPVARKHQDAIAELAGMSVAEFFHSSASPRLIPIIGYVSGGESFTPVADHEPGGGIDHVLLDMGDDADQIGVRVRGNSMQPVYRDGDSVIGTRLRSQSLTKAIGKDCIIMTAKGEGYLKILRRGSKAGLFTLRSYNPAYDDIEDVRINWVAPVKWVGRAG